MKDFAQSPSGGVSVAEQAKDMLASMLKWRENIERALQAADYSHTFDDITLMVLRGDLTYFEFENCYCIAQIVNFPQFKNFHIMIAGGSLPSMLDQVDGLRKLARAHGCKHLSFSGRKGFGKALADRGWKHRFTTMWTEVEQ